MSFDLIIFDCDGVLIDSEVLSHEVLAQLLGEHGYSITPHELSRRYVGLTDGELAEVITAETGIALPQDFASQAERRAMDYFPGRLQAIPGAVEILAQADYPRCVASNAMAERLAHVLTIAGLRPYLPEGTLFSSCMVARGKPAPDLHLLAAETFGATPSRCLVLEDTPTGIRAARSAGMTTVGFVGGTHVEDKARQKAALLEEGALQVIDDLTVFPDLLATLASEVA